MEKAKGKRLGGEEAGRLGDSEAELKARDEGRWMKI